MRWRTRIQVVASPLAPFVRVMWALVGGAAFSVVAEGGEGVVGDVRVVSACGSRSQVVNRLCRR